MLEGKTSDDIIFKKLDKKKLKFKQIELMIRLIILKANTSQKRMIWLKLQVCA